MFEPFPGDITNVHGIRFGQKENANARTGVTVVLAPTAGAVAGVSVHEANRLLGTARKANDLDKTKEAMKNGDLSPDQADTVTDAATADPSAEEDLLGCAARDTNAKLREEAAKRKAAATDTAARERRIRRNRSLRSGTDAEGALWFRGYGPGIDAARFEAMIRPFEELVFRHHRASGRRDTYETNATTPSDIATTPRPPGRRVSRRDRRPQAGQASGRRAGKPGRRPLVAAGD